MTKRRQGRPMPHRDPSFWQAIGAFLQQYAPNLFAAALTFSMALAQGLKHGATWRKSLVSAMTCTILAVGLYPLFVELGARWDLPPVAAFAPCVFLAFMGTDWLRAKADDLFEVLVGRWRR